MINRRLGFSQSIFIFDHGTHKWRLRNSSAPNSFRVRRGPDIIIYNHKTYDKFLIIYNRKTYDKSIIYEKESKHNYKPQVVNLNLYYEYISSSNKYPWVHLLTAPRQSANPIQRGTLPAREL